MSRTNISLFAIGSIFVTRTIRPEGFFFLASALALKSLVENRYYRLSIPAFWLCLYLHPVSLILAPVFIAGLWYRKPVLAGVAFVGAIWTINTFVDIENFSTWVHLMRYFHPQSTDYPGPPLLMHGLLWAHVVAFFERFCWIKRYDDLWTRVALRLSCFFALVWGVFQKEWRRDLRVWFILIYTVTTGLISGTEYTAVTDPFLIAGGVMILGSRYPEATFWGVLINGVLSSIGTLRIIIGAWRGAI